VIGGNYAWREFYGDFGGYSAFGAGHNIANHQNEVRADLQDMKQHCIDVVRVWLFPDMASDGLTWQGNCISAVGGTIEQDIRAFSQAAADAGVRIMWTYLSFDGYKSASHQGLPSFRPTLAQSTIDDTCRQAFMSIFVDTITRYIRDDPNRAATYWATDLINEPDWAIEDPTNPAFPGQGWAQDPDLEHTPGAIDYPAMRLFLQQMAAAVRNTDPQACVTIGTAGKKWASAWEDIVDINTPHSYFWDQGYFPTEDGPAALGLTKPTYYGEYPHAGYPQNNGSLPGSAAGSLPRTHTAWLCESLEAGYRGAFGWAYKINDVGGWTAATMDEANNFGNAALKTLAALDIEPAQVQCGETVTAVVRPIGPKGTPRTPVTFDNTGSAGMFSGLVYDQTTCEYTGQYTAPPCTGGGTSIVSLSARDELNNPASGTLSVLDDDTGGGTAGPICQAGASATVITGAGTGCTQTVITSGCVDNPSDCCPIATPDADNPACPDRGDFIKYTLSGCESCGGYTYGYGEGSKPPVTIGGGRLCIGPLADDSPYCVNLSCQSAPANAAC
jgi:hypothetical protein